MYSQEQLKNIIFFDIETATQFDSLDSLNQDNPKMAELWSKRCEYLRSRYEENKDLTDEELYLKKGALHAEFSRIVCISFARLAFKDGSPEVVMKSYCSEDEMEVLEGIAKVFSFNNFNFCGHNIKRFDVPVMCKRLIINGMPLPKNLQVQNLKPWEMPFIDTSELWSFGTWQESYTSLDLLSVCLGVDSPKGDIKGEQVSEVFWKDKDYSRISTYCEKDVESTVNIILKMSGLNA